MKRNNVETKIGYLLNTNKIVKISEILLVFILAFALIKLLTPYAGDNQLLLMGIIWSANILMIGLVLLGIKLRGQKWSDFGLTFGRISLKKSIRIFLLSLLACTLGAAGFMLGTLVMANISGMPESADMSVYEYLYNNIFMLVITLIGVYIISSFGEEVVYRAFLINRISELGFDSKYGKMATVIISAVIFGLVHYTWGPTGMVSTGLFGLAMGICYLKFKKNLWILVLAHAYLDTILLVQVYMSSN
ncbi:type II CAAX endopeptidase family protein [uncultured Draconibacterium sp.]|uniref:CPBP family intramembrane glutamic endopeptidase n=1 Tax=uncultured Draconibacterium sp. TaxID=1573823 RepID=UPI0029C70905|nr:type II CAAX endopeptidase family protein [uncultured Draconibacterium sp.]